MTHRAIAGLIALELFRLATAFFPAAGAEQQEELRRRDRLWAESRRLHAEGKLAAAVDAAEQVVAIERRLLGKGHEDLAVSLDQLGALYAELGRFDDARGAHREALALFEARYGPSHWKVTDARLALDDVDRLARLKPDGRRQLAKAERQNSRVVELFAQGKWQEAAELARESLQTVGRILGTKHHHVAAALNNLGLLHKSAGDYAEAERLYRRASGIWRETLTGQHPRYAASLNNLATLYQEQGDYARAEPLVRKALGINRQTLGPGHAATAGNLNNLAGLCQSMARFDEAEALYREAAEIRRKTLGENHPDYAQSLNNLAALKHATGELARAAALYHEALRTAGKSLGEEHPRYAAAEGNLGAVYEAMGDYRQAERLLREASDAWKRIAGDGHPRYAESLNNLAALHQSMGDYARAESLYGRALEIKERALGPEHPATITGLSNLGTLYYARGDYGRAEPRLRRALELRRKVLGETHVDCAADRNNLAALCAEMGDFARAELLYREATAIRKEVLGEGHPQYATALNNLAALYASTGDSARAEPLHHEALGIWKESLGPTHPRYAIGLGNLGLLYWSMKRPADAERLLHEAAAIARGNLELASLAQSERQQLLMAAGARGILDAALSLAAEGETTAREIYTHVLAWKGAVFSRQWRMRLARARADLAPQFDRLEQVVNRLAALSLGTPGPGAREARQRKIAELADEKERLERKLAAESGDFRRRRQTAGLSAAEFRHALPPGVVLVDFLEYTRFFPAGRSGPGEDKTDREFARVGHVAAFVVRADRPVRLVDLGPAGPITGHVETWRATLGSGPEAERAARELRRRLWEPLGLDLAGAGTVLLSPDGSLARFPFAALPGEEPGTYLTDDVPLAVVAVPQLLPELVQISPVGPAASERGQDDPPSLLLVGSVDYGAEPDAAGPATGRGPPLARSPGDPSPTWKPLPGTAEEIAAIARTMRGGFPQAVPVVLRDAEPTEAAVRREAPGRRWLHFATHGFFAPAWARSALAGSNTSGSRGLRPLATKADRRAGFHPGLLSGLVFAGASRPWQPGRDDGIMTADEVAAIDLRAADLAVLSACQTGLGPVAGGEGILGLQRAFQVAGARTVVASLWQVDDAATRALMTEFYENLLQKRMSKLEALRHAQLTIRRAYDPQQRTLRGLAPLKDPTTTPHGFDLPPRYWAAFILSGDWR
jgi:CHAT domain-containing protein/Flp pilus assembly protein TadD